MSDIKKEMSIPIFMGITSTALLSYSTTQREPGVIYQSVTVDKYYTKGRTRNDPTFGETCLRLIRE